jgi:16S rRNA (cytidine1402-2'-O)-methyltransferase
MGILYIVPTPIGNLQDITLRAIDVLKSADLVICEDTRVTGGLLYHLGIKKEMMVLNDNNEENKIYEIIDKLAQNLKIALVSDSGTPLISDPGFKLIRTAIQRKLQVIPLPGANAITTALCASGLPTDKFLFLGFPPHKNKRQKFFQEVKEAKYTVIFFESGHRIKKCLGELKQVLELNREVVVCRELTKKFETIYRGTIEIVEQQMKDERGEFVVVIK